MKAIEFGGGRVMHRQLNVGEGATAIQSFSPEACLMIWPAHNGLMPVGSDHRESMIVMRPGIGLDLGVVCVQVPRWFYDAWMADEPLSGLIDWLIENRAEEYPWLAEALMGVSVIESSEESHAER